MLFTSNIFFTLSLFMIEPTYNQSFKCLVKICGKETFFVHLHFECNKTRLIKTGCLKRVSVDYFYYSLIYKYLTHHPKFVKNPKENQIIKYENIDIFQVINKNRYKRNKKILELRNSKAKKITIGIPLTVDTKLLSTFNKIYAEDKINNVDIPNTNISFVLPITYKVKDNHIEEIKLPHGKTELIMCKETTGESKSQAFNLFEKFVRLVENQSPYSDPDEIRFDRYEKLYNKSTITKDNIKLAAITFLNRIDFKNMTSNEDITKLKVFYNYSDNPILFFKYNGMLFTFTDLSEDERSDAYLNSDYNSLSLFKLKKVYGKGENARKVHK